MSCRSLQRVQSQSQVKQFQGRCGKMEGREQIGVPRRRCSCFHMPGLQPTSPLVCSQQSKTLLPIPLVERTLIEAEAAGVQHRGYQPVVRFPTKPTSLTHLQPGSHSTGRGSERQGRRWQVKLETREKGQLTELENREVQGAGGGPNH